MLVEALARVFLGDLFFFFLFCFVFQPVIDDVEVIIFITSPTAYFCECACAYVCIVVQKAA